jgi:hypothetical protein
MLSQAVESLVGRERKPLFDSLETFLLTVSEIDSGVACIFCEEFLAASSGKARETCFGGNVNSELSRQDVNTCSV